MSPAAAPDVPVIALAAVMHAAALWWIARLFGAEEAGGAVKSNRHCWYEPPLGARV